MQLECFTMPETDIRLSWSAKDPFQFNPELTLPDFDFDKNKITLTKCDKSYETGTYRYFTNCCSLNSRHSCFSCIEAKFPLRRLLGYYMIGIYIPTGLAVVLSYLWFRKIFSFLYFFKKKFLKFFIKFSEIFSEIYSEIFRHFL